MLNANTTDLNNSLNLLYMQKIIEVMNNVKSHVKEEPSNYVYNEALVELVTGYKQKFINDEVAKRYLNATNGFGQTLLHTRVVGGSFNKYVRFWHCVFLIRNGVDPNLADNFGNTALHTLVMDFNSCMKTPNIKDLDKVTEYYFGFMGCLIAEGVDPTIKNKSGETALNMLKRCIEKTPKDIKNNLIQKDYSMESLANNYLKIVDYTNYIPSIANGVIYCLKEGNLYAGYKEPKAKEEILKWANKVETIEFGSVVGNVL